MVRIVSVDAETNGLYGAPFAVGVVARGGGLAERQFIGRCPILGPVDEWVDRFVLPALTNVPQTHDSLPALLEAFWAFWRSESEAGPVWCVAHCGTPVEAGLFRRCVEADLPTRQFQAPFPLHEVATLLAAAGHDIRSVESFLKTRAIASPSWGDRHHPLFDAEICLLAVEALLPETVLSGR